MQVRQLIAGLSLLYIGSVAAGPADYVYTPNVEQGEKEVDFKYGATNQQDGAHANVTSLGFGYGATEYWFTEVYLKREREGSEGLTIAEWENKFQLHLTKFRLKQWAYLNLPRSLTITQRQFYFSN